jgi:hypothetical protein
MVHAFELPISLSVTGFRYGSARVPHSLRACICSGSPSLTGNCVRNDDLGPDCVQVTRVSALMIRISGIRNILDITDSRVSTTRLPTPMPPRQILGTLRRSLSALKLMNILPSQERKGGSDVPHQNVSLMDKVCRRRLSYCTYSQDIACTKYRQCCYKSPVGNAGLLPISINQSMSQPDQSASCVDRGWGGERMRTMPDHFPLGQAVHAWPGREYVPAEQVKQSVSPALL